MKVVLVLLSSLALVAPARRYPSQSGGSGGGFGGGSSGGFEGGSSGGFAGGSSGGFAGGAGGGFGGGDKGGIGGGSSGGFAGGSSGGFAGGAGGGFGGGDKGGIGGGSSGGFDGGSSGGFAGGAGGGFGGGSSGGFTGGSSGGRYPGGSGGAPIIFPGQVGGGGGAGGGHIHDGHDHDHGVGIVTGGGSGGGGFSRFPSPIGHAGERLYRDACRSTNSLSHSNFGGHSYHFSWCSDGGQRYTWQGALNYCSGLGAGWYPVAVQSKAEDQFIINIVGTHRSPWIWTGGNRLHNENFRWEWSDKTPIGYFNWGQTGSEQIPQPDNAEDNNERCLAYLNQFYRGDLITWHDIGCHHDKPTICEHDGGQVSVPQYG